MKKLLTLLFVVVSYLTTVGQTDLEFSIKLRTEGLSINQPLQFTNRIYEVRVENKSNTTATNVSVQLDYSDEGDLRDFSYTSSTESQGLYEVVGKIWSIGTIPANGSALLELELFNMKTGFQRIFGQIITADGNDPDSTPGNNTNGIPSEDDEAIFGVNVTGATLPDYTIQNLEVTPLDLEVENSISVKLDFINSGSEAGDNSTRRIENIFALSPTPNYVPGTQVWFNRLYADREFIGTTEVTQDFVLADFIPDGTYYFVLVLDQENSATESDETNNTIVGPRIRVRNAALPDLAGTLNDLRLPDQVVAGATAVNQFLSFDNNSPIRTIAPFTTSLYLSSDNNLSPDDVLLTELLIPEYFRSYSPSLTIPFNTSPGNYFVIVHTDSKNDIVESDETNNFSSVPFQVVANNGVQPKPDLLATITDAPTTYDLCCPNRESLSYEIENIGNSGASAGQMGYFLSTDETFDSGDTELSVLRNAFSGNPGQVVNAPRRFIQLDDSTPPGNYFLLVVADIFGELDESDETNNVVASPLEVLRDQLPELSIVGATGDLIVEQGGVLNVQVTVQNEGERASEPTDLSLWRVPEFPRDGGEQISRVDIPAIPPNSQLTIDAAFPIRANQRIRDNYPSNLFIDFEQNVAEIDETNNLFGWLISVTEPTGDNRPDLTFTGEYDFFYNPHYLQENDPQFQPFVKNQGVAPSPGDIDVFAYLSTDDQLDAGDIFMGMTNTSFALPAGEEIKFFVPIEVSSNNILPDDYFLITVVDPDDKIDELNENNNIIAAPFKIQNTPQADLQITGIEHPANAGTDEPFDVTINFINNGEAFDRDFRVGLYLSPNNSTTITNSISFVSSAYEEPMAAGEQASVSFTIQGNQNISPREYYLVGFVDLNEQIVETNENNNAQVSPVTLGEGNAQFFIEFVDCPQEFPNPGVDLVYDISATNFGTDATEPTTIYLYHALNNPPVKVLYGSADVPSMAPNEVINVSISVPPSLYLPTGDNIGFGEKWLYDAPTYISLSPDGSTIDFSEATPLVNLNPGCRRYTTDLEIELSPVTPVIGPNNEVTFEMLVTNNGNEDAYNAISTIIFGNTCCGFPPPTINAEVTSGNVYRQNFLGGGGSTYRTLWYIPFLATGESTMATVTITPPTIAFWQAEGAVINRGVGSPHLIDPNEANNMASITIPRDDGGDEVDLELTATVDKSNPAAFDFFSPTFTLKNNSSELASDVRVLVSWPADDSIVPKGGDEFTASQGSYIFGTWLVGGLSPNETATLTLNFFNKNTDSKYVFAEVFRQDQEDVDSSPDNATPPNVNEDDEAVVFINGDVDPCDNDIVPPVFQGCVGNINATTSGDGVAVTWLLDPFAVDNCTPENEITISGTAQSGDFFPLGLTVVTFTATDNANNKATCSFNVMVTKEDLGDNPTVTLSTPSNIVDGSFTVSATFSESVSDFMLAEIEVTNGTKSNPAQQSGSQYSFTVTPIAEGEVTIFVPADAAFNSEGKGNLASDILKVQFGTSGEPDYAITTFSQPAEVIALTEFDLEATVQNQGDGIPSSNAVFKFYLSTDEQLDAADELLATAPISPLDPGASLNFTRQDDAPEAGDFYILYVLDEDENIADADRSNNFASLPIKVLPNEGGVDLELSGTASDINPPVYDFFSVSFTLTNNGDATASDIILEIPEDIDGAVPKGGDEFELSQGSYNPNEVVGWRVGTLEPGERATITLNYFNLSESEKVYYAEVFGQSPGDVDSEAQNGTPPIPNEDDEAVVTINGDSAELPDLIANNIFTAGSVTQIEPGEGFGVNVDLINQGALIPPAEVPVYVVLLFLSTDNKLTNDDIKIGNDLLISAFDSATLGGNTSSGIAEGEYFILVQIDATDVIAERNENNNVGVSSRKLTIGSLPDELPDLNLANLSGLPAFAKQGATVGYSFDLINSGTATASGDYIISAILSTDSNIGNADDVEVGVVNTGNTPVGTISSVQGAITIPNNLAPSAYFLILVADANNVITESNEANNFLSGSITIQEGDGGEGVDLNLVSAASNNAPSQWSFFSVEFVVSNQGDEMATDIEVEIPVVDGIKLKGGDEYTSTQGTFQAYGDRRWYLGDLDAGQSATLVLNYFNTTNNAVTIFGQVTQIGQEDVDSTPNNNNTNVPNEDDETAVTVNVSAADLRSTKLETFSLSRIENQIRDFQILKIYPSLTANDTRIVLNSKKETTLQMKVYNIKGQEVFQQAISVVKGINEIDVEASSFDSGMYHVLLQAENGVRPLTTRFIKQKH